MLNTPENSYVVTTWEELCPCGKIHRIIYISDSDASPENGLALHSLCSEELPLQTTPTQHVIGKDMLDGFLHKEMKP